MLPASTERPQDPAIITHRAAKTFTHLIRTEAELIESNAFEHVNHVAILNSNDDKWWHSLGERAVELGNYSPDALIDEADTFTSEWGRKPRLIYTMNDNGTLHAVFH